MKQYPKLYENITRSPTQGILDAMGSSIGSLDDLVSRFKSFYQEAYPVLFDLIVKEVWLEQKFTYARVRRRARSANGIGPDWAFSHFLKSLVGASQKPLTTGHVFVVVPTYFKDFFPNFSDHDPFLEAKYFEFPYKNITIDHLLFVYQYHDRMELLEEADRRAMTSNDFLNWAANIAMSYRDKKGRKVYVINRISGIPYIKKAK